MPQIALTVACHRRPSLQNSCVGARTGRRKWWETTVSPTSCWRLMSYISLKIQASLTSLTNRYGGWIINNALTISNTRIQTGAWGKLLKTIEALSGPHTLNFLTYTDRGHHKLFTKYLDRIKRAFHVVEVAPHLLHPQYKTGCPGRLEHHVGDVRIFSLAKKL